MTAGAAYVAQRKRESAARLLVEAHTFAIAHMKTRPFQKTMRRFLVKLSADNTLTVHDKNTGEVLAVSVQGHPTTLAPE
jgi:hypothetical protein